MDGEVDSFVTIVTNKIQYTNKIFPKPFESDVLSIDNLLSSALQPVFHIHDVYVESKIFKCTEHTFCMLK